MPGAPDMPMNAGDVEDKFIRYATPAIGAERAAAMANSLLKAPLTSPLKDILER